MRYRWLLLCAATSACAHYVKLDPKNVTSMQVIAGDKPNDRRICARGGLVEVAVQTKDGKTYYEGTRGIVDEKRFDPALVSLRTNIGTMHDRSWNPPDIAVDMLDKTVTITATLVKNPSITSTIELEPHWACDPQTAPAGGEGGNGGEGGAYGEAGGQGGDGGGGGAGGHAPRSTITIGTIAYKRGQLVLVTVEPEGWPAQAYLLDRSIKLRVFAGGGGGGGGGPGGPGGDAPEAGRRGGNGGRGGDGGDGGDGGEVTVYYDSASPELAKYVVVDTSAGPGGDVGEGGYGGGAAEDSLVGHQGPAGRPGRNGRPGPAPRFIARAGISQMMAESVGARRAIEPTRPEPTPTVATTRPGKRPGKPGKVERTPPSHPAPPPPTKPVRREDGARLYVGKATLEVVIPRHPAQRRSERLEVTSTRTRRRHFTIELSPKCAISFHRPPGEKRHVYDLDAPVTCADKRSKMTIHTARLELDSVKETLSLAVDAKISADAGGKTQTGTAHLVMRDAVRR